MAISGANELERFRRYYQVLEPALAKPKNRAYTTAVFSLLAISLFGWYAIRPTIQTILYLRREIADKEVVNKKMEDKISTLIEAQLAYQAAEPLLPAIDSALPERPEVVSLVSQIRNLSNLTQATISGLALPSVYLIEQEATPGAGRAQAKKPSADFTFTVIISGTYNAIKAFVEGIVVMQRIATVEVMNILPSRDTAGQSLGEPTLQLTLKLKTYFIGE